MQSAQSPPPENNSTGPGSGEAPGYHGGLREGGRECGPGLDRGHTSRSRGRLGGVPVGRREESWSGTGSSCCHLDLDTPLCPSCPTARPPADHVSEQRRNSSSSFIGDSSLCSCTPNDSPVSPLDSNLIFSQN